MKKKIIIKSAVILLWAMSICLASEGKKACTCPNCVAKRQAKEEVANDVDKVLKQLNQKTSELTSIQAKIEYKFIQPLLESEMFGHLKGSFTGASVNKQGLFEAANGGTIFLDEIGSMPLSNQGKLLRVLQEKEIRQVGSNENIRANLDNLKDKDLLNTGDILLLIRDPDFDAIVAEVLK